MPCLLVVLALLTPRVTAAALWLFTDFFLHAFAGRITYLILGLCFLPWTTLAYAWAFNATHGSIEGTWQLPVFVGAVLDLSTFTTYRRV